MRRTRNLATVCCFMLSWLFLSGCASVPESLPKTVGNDTSEIDAISASLDAPQAEVFADVTSAPPITAATVKDLSSYSYREMGLTEVINHAMQHSTVLRELGGTVLRNPDGMRTQFTQKIQNTDPRFGREAALSVYDTQFDARAIFNNNDRIFNNSFFAGGTTGFKQDLHDYEASLSKLTATGSQISVRSFFSHDSNNAPANTFPSAWTSYVEGEVRQPLLQGGGLEFNRIAGPNAQPGVYNGLLIARANADINQADFEVAIRDFISNVENAYWDLYYAYRDVDARRKAMLKAQDAWQKRKALESESDPAELALAKEQYYRFKGDLDEAVAGRLVQGTQNRNGSTGGTLRGTGGLLTSERKLRLLVGLPTSDGSLIRPATEPITAEVKFDWNSTCQESFTQRAELRQQQARIRKREMELVASKNFLNPRLDVFGRYRFRGFGDDLIASGQNGGTSPASAVGNMATGDYQEWTTGVEVNVPLGYRRAHAAVANAELRLARARAVYRAQQRQVVNDLGNAIADVDRARVAISDNLNRYLAAEEALDTLIASDEKVGRVEVDRILDAQRRAVEAEIKYFRSRSEYAVALKNVHFEKGSLMELNNIRLSGGPDIGQGYSNGPPMITPGVGEEYFPIPDADYPVPTGNADSQFESAPEIAPEVTADI
ncbi:MAG: TolC family protein [Planctomycetaceae bacterium]